MRLGFGCVNLGSASSGRSWRADVRLVELAVDEGVTLFDTADVYGSGTSERILGRALRRRRADVIDRHQGGLPLPPTHAGRAVGATRRRRRCSAPFVAPLRRQRPRRRSGQAARTPSRTSRRRPCGPAVDGSLRRLRTDYVDVLQLHGPDHVMPDLFERARRPRHRRQGPALRCRCRVGGRGAAWIGVRGAAVVQLPFGVLDPEAAETALPEAARRLPPRCGRVACSVVGCWRLPRAIPPPSPTIRRVR